LGQPTIVEGHTGLLNDRHLAKAWIGVTVNTAFFLSLMPQVENVATAKQSAAGPVACF
jgi:hypothetical protein